MEHVLAALDGLIKMTKERFGMMDLDSDGRKSFKGVPSEARRSFRRSVSYSESNNSFFPSPITPRSVIPGTMMSSSSSTSPSLWNLRAQALDKLSPVDLKQLAMRILSRRDSDSLLDLDLKNIIEEEQEESEKLGENDEENDSSVSETEHGSETEHVNETEHHIKGYETEHESEGEHHIESTGTEHVNEEEHHNEGSETEHEDHSEPTTSETDSTESFQEAISVAKQAPPPPPPSPPPPSPSPSFLNKKATPLSQPPPPPPPSSPQPGRKTLSPPPPPPPSRGHGSGDNSPTTPAPPAPPGSGRTLRGKRTTSKLRRSAQIANLYWVLKGKLEGRGGVEGKTSKASKGQHSVPDKSPVKGARSGMADALAEMTKR